MPRRKNERRPYCIVGAYDTETTNISSWYGVEAFPILHQLGTVAPHTDYTSVTSENVEQVVSLEMYRHADEIYTDIMGNLVAVKRAGTTRRHSDDNMTVEIPNAPRLMFAAHMDSVDCNLILYRI